MRAKAGPSKLFVGLMSGTSLDGVDAALVETDGQDIACLGPSLTLAYDASLRRRLRALLDRAPAIGPDDAELRAVERALTERHVAAVRTLLGRARVAASTVAAIGFHGQTILHRPESRRTWQIGDATLLARASGIPVVHDFRSADVAAGGQGAPLVPLFHAALLAPMPKPLAVLNLGGVANVTWLGKDGRNVAADCGPGNGLLDDWIAARTGRAFDAEGRVALQGRVDEGILAQLLAHPFFALPPPKSLDRLGFAEAIAAAGLQRLSTEDGAATLVALTARAVAVLVARLPSPPLRWIVSGGGRRNAAVIRALQAALQVPVEPVEAVGQDGDALEAQAFAFLAARSVAGLPLSLPGTTGVPRPMPGGRLVRPDRGSPPRPVL